MLRTAPKSGADVVVFDLEDAVGPGHKATARSTVADVLTDTGFDPDCEVLVRVNPLPTGEADLDAVLAEDGRPDGIVLPKVDRKADVRALSATMRSRGTELPVFALVETAEGVLHAESIAEANATDALVFGAEDLAADLGATRTDDGEEISYARQHVVLAARATGVDAIDTLCTITDDPERVRRDARRTVEFGYDGKLAIHPVQIDPIHDAFAPDEHELEWARRVIAASERHEGVFELDGRMIDSPVIRQAERLLDRVPD